MKKVAIMAIILSVTTAANAAGWKPYYSSSDGNKYLIDPSTKITSGDGTEVSMKAMWKFSNPSKYNGAASVKMVLKAACLEGEQSLHSMESTAYNAKGKVLAKDGMTELDITSNPVNAAAFKSLCSGAQ